VLSQLDGLTAPGIVNDLPEILKDDCSHYSRVFAGGMRAMRWAEKYPTTITMTAMMKHHFGEKVVRFFNGRVGQG
jgi:hypothetical protein